MGCYCRTKRISENTYKDETVLQNNNALELNSDAYHYDALGRNLGYKISFDLEKNVYQRVWNKSKRKKESNVHALLKSETLSGYVKAEPMIRICYKSIRIEGDARYFISEGSLRMKVGRLVYQGNNETLISHEKRHKEIWSDSKYSGSWTLEFSVASSKTKKEICENAVEIMWWQKISVKLSDLYNAQNAWDDYDTNNNCKDRIDVNAELINNYNSLISQICLKK
ncbi:MAG: hypothetical protein MJZ10_07165 [Fibrobacter sp.]|nr:hypothetical protein [Fibrobacter sp.]